jgi:hypothetical protein
VYDYSIFSHLVSLIAIMAAFNVSKVTNYSVEADSEHGVGILKPVGNQTNREFYERRLRILTL